jgi:nitrogen-specific signal transduction histidine kinase
MVTSSQLRSVEGATALPDPTTSILANSVMTNVVDATDAYVAILDRDQEVVFANKALLDVFDGDLIRALGRRFGELLGCQNADGEPTGCGSTAACLECGARMAVEAVGSAPSAQEECRILRKDGDPVDLEVNVVPMFVGSTRYTVLTALDISDRKRRAALERIFFHDIMNTASGMQGLSTMVRSVPTEERDELLDLIETTSNQLIEEISAQRELLAAEASELETAPQHIHSLQMLHTVVGLYSSHEVAAGKTLVVAPDSDDVEFSADPALLSRVLGNLTKNALEASHAGETVTLACRRDNDEVAFTVHNPAFIPAGAQTQIFLRSYTTKGQGRGLGTYSSRLITKRYLHGDLDFESTPSEGTTFTARYPVSH